jgi:hypothetical protein
MSFQNFTSASGMLLTANMNKMTNPSKTAAAPTASSR